MQYDGIVWLFQYHILFSLEGEMWNFPFHFVCLFHKQIYFRLNNHLLKDPDTPVRLGFIFNIQ